jgi:hypothetical protein
VQEQPKNRRPKTPSAIKMVHFFFLIIHFSKDFIYRLGVNLPILRLLKYIIISIPYQKEISLKAVKRGG